MAAHDPGGTDRPHTVNLVWVGDVFAHLHYFTTSLLEHTDARFRFVANGCSPESLAQMDAFAQGRPDQVVEILDVSPGHVSPHGVALDEVLRRRDDGPSFSFMDTDIKALGPWLPTFDQLLTSHDAITSGEPFWKDPVVVPEGTPWIAAGAIVSENGFTYGCPHVAFYRRTVVEETIDRWGAGFGAVGEDLDVPGSRIPDKAVRRLRETGHRQTLFDTGKVLNILLQEDGSTLCHIDHPALLHVGGISDHLTEKPHADALLQRFREETQRLGRGITAGMLGGAGRLDRMQVARFAADTVRAAHLGLALPDVPAPCTDEERGRLEYLASEIVSMVAPTP
jgi:hypothetical protein